MGKGRLTLHLEREENVSGQLGAQRRCGGAPPKAPEEVAPESGNHGTLRDCSREWCRGIFPRMITKELPSSAKNEAENFTCSVGGHLPWAFSRGICRAFAPGICPGAFSLPTALGICPALFGIIGHLRHYLGICRAFSVVPFGLRTFQPGQRPVAHRTNNNVHRELC